MSPRVGLLADQCAAIVVGAFFLVLGIADAVANGGMLLGVFTTSLWLTLIYLALGVAGLVLSRSFHAARWYLFGGGLICAALWLYGTFTSADVLELNRATNWLHFGLAVAMLIFGLTLAGTKTPRGARGEPLLPQ
ncbi:DUF4383 domain-containing protein [Mycolicibacterium confluentis]|uniref:Membrane protein n=1 Tax=Mycolicibacterium confluentis TaxID=28047 RepID=A0A7I7XS10_9MYCO|nr:DUF4383 domain-containing protein [Mycolicibacterium confluentis]MCV7318887.1 DUF4383 domain-containing protein [Mycolicibacterium confluentis]ORV23013.1 hypothetical protein AWB99_24065 [Mycolicibacterium confluentis]BBZ32039.1 membrane protein [Mycolicibacterium confluentis]